MAFYIQLFWRIFNCKETPANVPSSRALFRILILLTFILGFAHLFFATQKPLLSAMMVFFDIAVLIVFTHLLLRMFNYEARFLQAITALVGMNLVVIIITLPAKMYISKKMPAYMELLKKDITPEPDFLLFASGVFMIIIFIKFFNAMAQIFAHTLEVSKLKALLYCSIYFIMSFLINDSLLSLFAKGSQV